jgi:hypothetical protein
MTAPLRRLTLSRTCALPGVLLALVALAMQLAAASVVPFAPAAAGLDRLVAASICHGDGAAWDHGNAPAPHHAPDCAVCPVCQVVAHAGPILATPLAVFAAPALFALRADSLPPSRAPPGAAISAHSARGPPATV